MDRELDDVISRRREDVAEVQIDRRRTLDRVKETKLNQNTYNPESMEKTTGVALYSCASDSNS